MGGLKGSLPSSMHGHGSQAKRRTPPNHGEILGPRKGSKGLGFSTNARRNLRRSEVVALTESSVAMRDGVLERAIPAKNLE